MPFTTNSPNMLLPIPTVGVDPGPQFATDTNNCLTVIDGHDHSIGHGVQVTPSGLNINADLSFNDNNATLLRSARFQAQSAVLTLPTDLDCLFVQGVDLYFNDGAGNHVRITQSGGVAGSPGSISNLTSPASASYVAVDQTFVWQSAANTPANLDAASIILRNLVVNSFGLTLNPPAAMGSDLNYTLPTLPTTTQPISISSSGAMSAAPITYTQLSAEVRGYLNTIPTIQVLTSGSGTYTTPANVTYLKIKMIGGGGGGGGSSSGAGVPGSSGTSSTFGTILTANGGGGGDLETGGVGGTATISSPAFGSAFHGADGSGAGQTSSTSGSNVGGAGAPTPFGGGGVALFRANGSDAYPNLGSGGGGGSGLVSLNGENGGGGGAGGYIEAIVPAPAATYAYSVGTGGSGSSGGNTNGGSGSNGIIIVEEHYGS